MADARQQFGRQGESDAEAYLRRKGYRILERNARSSSGELDLIARDGGVLVFVEVKSRRTDAFGGAIHAVDARKQARLVRLAAQYLARHRLRDQACRFDVVLVQGMPGKGDGVEHIPNAFEVSGCDLSW